MARGLRSASPVGMAVACLLGVLLLGPNASGNGVGAYDYFMSGTNAAIGEYSPTPLAAQDPQNTPGALQGFSGAGQASQEQNEQASRPTTAVGGPMPELSRAASIAARGQELHVVGPHWRSHDICWNYPHPGQQDLSCDASKTT